MSTQMSTNVEGKALKIALCEDNPVDAELVSALIEMGDTPYTLDVFPSGEAFLEQFEKGQYDLILLDVYMAEISGVETAERIREVDEQVVIIFTTSSEDYTREGYRLNAYKYLLKPLKVEGITDAIELAVLKRDKGQDATLAFIADDGPVVVSLSDIIYIETAIRKTVVHTTDRTYTSSMPITDFALLLPAPRFLPSHRAYIVNLDHVDYLKDDFVMSNGDVAYVAIKNHKKIRKAYWEYRASKSKQ